MTIRGFLKLLLPPVVPVVWRRIRPAPSPTAPQSQVAADHVVTGGVLRGHLLHVAADMPSYRDMLSGAFDNYLFDALPAGDLSGKLVLDIGTHIGFHALSFAARYPQARVVAFEPNPVNIDRAKLNISLSPDLAPRIDLMELALSDTNGVVHMSGSSNVEDQTSSGSYIDRASRPLDERIYRKSNFKEFPVPCRRLDDLADECGWRNVAVMKIDVEGAEHLVLQGARQILERDHPMLLIEIHTVVCMLEVMELLGPLGYKVRLLHEDGASRCFISAN